MRLWPLFGRARAPQETKASATARAVAVYSMGRAIWTPRRYDLFAKEGYVENAVAHRCVKYIAQGAAAVPWLLYKGDAEIETHAILDLLKRPAPQIGGASLFEAFYAYWAISGNAYLEIVPGKRSELYALRPDRMTVVPSSLSGVGEYVHKVGLTETRFPVDPFTGKSQILHLKSFHPTDDWYGLGGTEPASKGVDRHNAANDHNTALLQNGAAPSGALVYKPLVIDGQAIEMDEESLKAAKKRLDERFSGVQNAGRPMVLDGNVSWEAWGLSPKDMDFIQGKEDAAREIATAYGVPYILVVPGEATYNNRREAKLELYEETICPLLDRTADALNSWLPIWFGDEKLRLEYDKDAITALAPRRELEQTNALALFNAGVIDLDEARDRLQYDEKQLASLKPDATLITALLGGIEKGNVTQETLNAYLRSVGLEDKSDKEIAAALEEMNTPSQDELIAAQPPGAPPAKPGAVPVAPPKKPNGAAVVN